MKSRTLSLCPLFFIFSALSLSFEGRAAAELVQATVLSIVGDVKLVTNEGHVIEMSPQCEIEEGMKIETGVDGKLLIRWTEGAYSVLSPNTSLTVIALNTTHYSTMITRQVVLRLLQGTLCDEVVEESGFTIFRVKSPFGEFTNNGARDRLTADLASDGTAKHGEVSVQRGEVRVQFNDDQLLTVAGGFQMDLAGLGNSSLNARDFDTSYQTDGKTYGDDIKSKVVRLQPQESTNIENSLQLLAPNLFTSNVASNGSMVRLTPSGPESLVLK